MENDIDVLIMGGIFVLILAFGCLFTKYTRSIGIHIILVIGFGTLAGFLWNKYNIILGFISIFCLAVITYPKIFKKIEKITGCIII